MAVKKSPIEMKTRIRREFVRNSLHRANEVNIANVPQIDKDPASVVRAWLMWASVAFDGAILDYFAC